MRLNTVKRLFLFSLLVACAAAMPSTRPLAREMAAVDLAGQSRRVIEPNAKATVLLFVGIECPVSNGYAPEISRLADAYRDRGVPFYVVYSGTDVRADVARQHAKEFKFTCPALLDSHCALAMATGATMTLEAIVILPDGSIAYRGRVDDQYVMLGKKRFAPTSHDLADAIDAVLAGKAIEPRVTQAVGCSIVMPEMKQP